MMRDWAEAIFVFGCFIYPVLGQVLPGEILNYDYGCWGEHVNESYTHMNANCSRSAVIAVRGVRAGAKVSSMTICQRQINRNDSSSFFDQCCKENPSLDCTFDFNYPNLYDLCSGKSRCDPAVLVRQDVIKCHNGNYGYSENGTNHSTYMIFDHYCIEASRILACPSRGKLEGKVVYVQSDDYVKRMARDCKCSITTQNSTIMVYTVHNELWPKSDSNGTCMNNNSSSIVFTDRNGTTEYKTTCEWERKITQPFNSSSNYLSMIFHTFTGQTTGGFWFAFKATEMSATVTIQCLSDDLDYTPPPPSPSPPPPELPLVWIIIAVIGSLIFLIILVICCKKCCSDDPPAGSNKIQSNDIEWMSANSPVLVTPTNTKWKLPGPVVSPNDTPSTPGRHTQRKKSRIIKKNATPQPNVLTIGLQAATAIKDHTNTKNARKAKKKKKRKKKRKHRSKTHEEQDRVENASTENDAMPTKDDGKNDDKDAKSGGDTREQNIFQYD